MSFQYGRRRLLNLIKKEGPLNPKRCLSGQMTVSPSVTQAISNGEPVVALESTIITHGMPYPANLSMAKKVENIIRSTGAVPATVAIIEGRVHVGLSVEELEYLASTKSALKVSRRDFPYAIANKLDGGTTVSGTMVVAHRAGIQVFVTGGVGGVHRGATTTMDISADLTELSRTPVLVVSAGVKSILDIGLTLEYLETMGVCVATLAEGLKKKSPSNFPAFYTRDSGFRSPYTVNSALEAASLFKANLDLNLDTGLLLGVPIPVEHEGDSSIDSSIRLAVKEAEEKGLPGKEITPFILSRLNELTAGDSLRTNIALVENNARVGGEVAVNLAKLLNTSSTSSFSSSTNPSSPSANPSPSSGPVVVGGCIFDFVVKVQEDEMKLNGSTHLGKLQYSHGGVGRNVADALGRLGAQPRLISAVGEDNQGTSIINQAKHVDTSMVAVLADKDTATYTAVLDRTGECKFGVGDMEIHHEISAELIMNFEDDVSKAPLVVSDGNVPEHTLDFVLELCTRHSVPLFFEPTDLRKASKPLSSKFIGGLTYTSPNLNELLNMARTLPNLQDLLDIEEINKDTIETLADLSVRLLDGFGMSVILLTLSEKGVLLTRRGLPEQPLPTKYNPCTSSNSFSCVHYPGSPATHIISVSGAGDCLTAGFIAGILEGRPQSQCVSAGMQAAKLSCGVSAAVPDKLSMKLIDWNLPVEAVRIL